MTEIVIKAMVVKKVFAEQNYPFRFQVHILIKQSN